MYFKPSYYELIGNCISENAKFMPLIFEGNLVNVFRYSGKARGVDWLVFLKYFVETVLLDYVGYKETLRRYRMKPLEKPRKPFNVFL